MFSKTFAFTKATGGAPASQSVALPFTPKAVLLWTTGVTADGSWAGTIMHSIGFSAGASESGACATFMEDGVNGTSRQKRMAAKVVTLVGAGGATIAECDLTDFTDGAGGGGITLSWTTNNASAYVIHGIAWGGSDVSAKVLKYTRLNTLGLNLITGVGFRPDAAFVVSATDVTAGAVPATQIWAHHEFGVAARRDVDLPDSWGWCYLSTGEFTVRTLRSFTAGILGRQSDVTVTNRPGVIEVPVEFPSDGMTLRTDDPASSTWQAFALFIKGGTWGAVNTAKPTGAATATQTLSDLPVKPQGFFASSVWGVPTDAHYNGIRVGMGAADARGGMEASVLTDKHNVSTTVSRSLNKSTAALIKADNDADTVDAEVTAVRFTRSVTPRSGKWQIELDWTTNDGVADEIGFLWWGPTYTERDVPRTRPKRAKSSMVGG